MNNRKITQRNTPHGNIEVIITQDGLDFVNIRKTTTVNIYNEDGYLKGEDAINSVSMGDSSDSFTRFVKFWLKDNQE